MQRWTSLTLRAAFIVGFLIVLPVMAMPSVADFLDRLLYGQPESSVPPMTKPDLELAPREERELAQATRAAYEEPLSTEPALTDMAGNLRSAPPRLSRTPDFPPRHERPDSSRETEEPADVGPLDQATALKIDAIRGRLAELGAEYVRLELSADGRTYHCLCDMLLGGDPQETQAFEATRDDPVAAAEAVLAKVAAWRDAENAPEQASKSEPTVRPR
jgi:hypothetical protein